MMRTPGSRRAAAIAMLATGSLLAFAGPAGAQDAGPPVAAGPVDQSVTFDVRDQPINDVLDYIRGAARNVNIVVATEAEGERVTLAVRNMSWRDALDEIALRTGCTVEEVNPSYLRVEKPPRVSFSFEQADIGKVIRTIAALSGANIVSDPDDVRGMVTVNLINVPWRRALEAIVGTKGYQVVEEDGGILRVVSPDKLMMELETRVVQLRFLRPPPNFGPKLPGNEHVEKYSNSKAGGNVEESFPIIRSLREALRPEGTLEYIDGSNSLVLKGTKPKLAEVEKMIAKLDQEPMQIFVDMQFISTSNRDLFDVGMGPGEAGIQGFMTLAGAENAVALPFNTGSGGFEDSILADSGFPNVNGIDPVFRFGSLDFSQTSYVLRLLRNDVRSRIVQAPKLFLLDNQEATIFVGESIRYAETEASSSQSGTLQFSISEASASPINVGFQLLMVGHVIPQTDKIMMTIVPTQNTLTGTSPELPGFDRFSVGGASAEQVIFLPRESSSTLVTTLVTQHGVTAVIGGLMQDTNAETTQKVPFLGDLPLLGWLFKSQQKSKTSQQLMIFLTPWLVKDSSMQRNAIESELLRREPSLDAEWERLAGDALSGPSMEGFDVMEEIDETPVESGPEKMPAGAK